MKRIDNVISYDYACKVFLANHNQGKKYLIHKDILDDSINNLSYGYKYANELEKLSENDMEQYLLRLVNKNKARDNYENNLNRLYASGDQYKKNICINNYKRNYRDYLSDNYQGYIGDFLGIDDSLPLMDRKNELLKTLDSDFKIYYSDYKLPPIIVTIDEWKIFFDILYDFYKSKNLGDYTEPQIRKYFRYFFANIIYKEDYGLKLSELNIYSFIHSIMEITALDTNENELQKIHSKMISCVIDNNTKTR